MHGVALGVGEICMLSCCVHWALTCHRGLGLWRTRWLVLRQDWVLLGQGLAAAGPGRGHGLRQMQVHVLQRQRQVTAGTCSAWGRFEAQGQMQQWHTVGWGRTT